MPVSSCRSSPLRVAQLPNVLESKAVNAGWSWRGASEVLMEALSSAPRFPPRCRRRRKRRAGVNEHVCSACSMVGGLRCSQPHILIDFLASAPDEHLQAAQS